MFSENKRILKFLNNLTNNIHLIWGSNGFIIEKVFTGCIVEP